MSSENNSPKPVRWDPRNILAVAFGITYCVMLLFHVVHPAVSVAKETFQQVGITMFALLGINRALEAKFGTAWKALRAAVKAGAEAVVDSSQNEEGDSE